MEDVYTIKVKTKPDTRNLYPSERRYSASTVSGLAWVHIALAATSFLLACLALVNPNSNTDIKRLTLNDTEEKLVDRSELIFNLTEFDVTTDNGVFNDNLTVSSEGNEETKDETNGENKKKDNNYILVIAPTLLTIFASAAGIASIMASVRWYIDRNITWLFFISIVSSIFAFISVIMIVVWLITTGGEISDSQNESFNSKDFIIVKNSDVIHRNESHIIIKNSSASEGNEDSSFFTKRVLSINILIASVLELLWSILSVKIAYKGMRNTYKEDNDRRGHCISVVTTIKGNTNKLPRNAKLIPPKPDLIDHYPSTKIKRIFLAQSDNGFYLKNQNNKAKNTETSSEFYKERMMNFLNRCASQANNSGMRTPSETESVLNVIPEVTTVEASVEDVPAIKDNSRITPVSWGDTPEHTIYNQNTLNLDKIFNFKKDEKKTVDQDKKTISQEEVEDENDSDKQKHEILFGDPNTKSLHTSRQSRSRIRKSRSTLSILRLKSSYIRFRRLKSQYLRSCVSKSPDSRYFTPKSASVSSTSCSKSIKTASPVTGSTYTIEDSKSSHTTSPGNKSPNSVSVCLSLASFGSTSLFSELPISRPSYLTLNLFNSRLPVPEKCNRSSSRSPASRPSCLRSPDSRHHRSRSPLTKPCLKPRASAIPPSESPPSCLKSGSKYPPSRLPIPIKPCLRSPASQFPDFDPPANRRSCFRTPASKSLSSKPSPLQRSCLKSSVLTSLSRKSSSSKPRCSRLDAATKSPKQIYPMSRSATPKTPQNKSPKSKSPCSKYVSFQTADSKSLNPRCPLSIAQSKTPKSNSVYSKSSSLKTADPRSFHSRSLPQYSPRSTSPALISQFVRSPRPANEFSQRYGSPPPSPIVSKPSRERSPRSRDLTIPYNKTIKIKHGHSKHSPRLTVSKIHESRLSLQRNRCMKRPLRAHDGGRRPSRSLVRLYDNRPKNLEPRTRTTRQPKKDENRQYLEKLLSKTMDVHYIVELKNYFDKIRSSFTCGAPECLALQERLRKHKMEHHETHHHHPTRVQNEQCSVQTCPEMIKRISSHNSAHHSGDVKGSGAQTKITLTNLGGVSISLETRPVSTNTLTYSQEGIDGDTQGGEAGYGADRLVGQYKTGIEAAVRKWVIKVPTQEKTPEDTRQKEDAIRSLIDNLIAIDYTARDAHAILRDEIDHGISNLNLWYPGSKSDREAFKDGLRENLFDSITNLMLDGIENVEENKRNNNIINNGKTNASYGQQGTSSYAVNTMPNSGLNGNRNPSNTSYLLNPGQIVTMQGSKTDSINRKGNQSGTLSQNSQIGLKPSIKIDDHPNYENNGHTPDNVSRPKRPSLRTGSNSNTNFGADQINNKNDSHLGRNLSSAAQSRISNLSLRFYDPYLRQNGPDGNRYNSNRELNDLYRRQNIPNGNIPNSDYLTSNTAQSNINTMSDSNRGFNDPYRRSNGPSGNRPNSDYLTSNTAQSNINTMSDSNRGFNDPYRRSNGPSGNRPNSDYLTSNQAQTHRQLNDPYFKVNDSSYLNKGFNDPNSNTDNIASKPSYIIVNNPKYNTNYPQIEPNTRPLRDTTYDLSYGHGNDFKNGCAAMNRYYPQSGNYNGHKNGDELLETCDNSRSKLNLYSHSDPSIKSRCTIRSKDICGCPIENKVVKHKVCCGLKMMDIEQEISNWLKKCTVIKYNGLINRQEVIDALIVNITPYLSQPYSTLNKAVLKAKIMNVLRGLGLCNNNTCGMKTIIQKLAEELSNRLIGVVSRLECSGQISWKCKIKANHPFRNFEEVHVGPNQFNKQQLKYDLMQEFEYCLRGSKLENNRDVLENITGIILDKIELIRRGIDDAVKHEIKTILINTYVLSDVEATNILNNIMKNTREVLLMITTINDRTNTAITARTCLSKTLSIYTSEHEMTPSFAVPGASTPKKKKDPSKLGPEEKAYTDKIASVIREWILSKPVYFENLNDINMNEVMILDLAGELVDHAKLGQLMNTPDKESIMTHYIYKWLMKFEIVDDLKLAKPHIKELVTKLQAISVPQMTRSQHGTRQTMKNLKQVETAKSWSESFVPGAQDILEDEISIWMNEYPSDIYVNKEKSAQNKLVHKLSEKLKDKKSDKDISKEIKTWLKTVVKPNEKDRIDSMSTSLRERITKLPQDKTIAANVAKKKQYKKEMYEDTPEMSQNDTEVEENNKTLKEFIVKYVEHNCDEDDPLAKGAYARLLITELRRLSPKILKGVYEGQPVEKFAPQTLFRELQYIKDISDWLKTLPIDDNFNKVENQRRTEFIINLAKEINHIEEERRQSPDAMNYDDMIGSIVCEYMHTIPVKVPVGTSFSKYLHPIMMKIFNKREENMPLLPHQLWGNIADFLDDYVRLNGNDIADDEAKLEVWVTRLLQEIKKMIAENPSSLPVADVNDRLAEVAKPGDETIKRFSHELDFAKEISDWLKNFPLIDSVDEEIIKDLAENMAECETETDDSKLINYIEQWIPKLPLDKSKKIDVPLVIQQLLNRRNKVIKEKATSLLPSSDSKTLSAVRTVKSRDRESVKSQCRGCCPVDDPGFITVQVIKEWCDKLPLEGTEHDINKARTDIANELYQKVIEINDNPYLARSDMLYMKSLLERIDELFENLPPNVKLEDDKEELKTELFNNLRQARIFSKQVSLGDDYMRELEDAIQTAVSNPARTAGTDPGFEMYKENMAEMFILDNFDHGNDADNRKYKKKIQNEVDKFSPSAQQRTGVAVPEERLNNDTLSILFDVSMPVEKAMVDNVVEIKTKCEIDDWVQKVPLRPVRGPAELLERDQKVRLLARKIHILEFEKDPDEKIHKEITKWLTKAPLLSGEEVNIDKFANDLQDILKKTQKSRKCVQASDAVLVPQDDENSIWVNPNTSIDQKNPPRHKTGDILLDIVEKWSNNIPFSPNVPKDQTDAMKDDVTVQIIKKISELNSARNTFNDDKLYNYILNQEIEKALAGLPQSDNLVQSKGALVHQLTSAIESVKPLIREERARHKYKTELENTVGDFLGAPVNPTAQEQTLFNKIQEEIVDDFVEYQYNKNDDEGKEFYKSKMLNALIKYNFIGESDENRNEIISDTLVETNRLLCELQKVCAPKDINLNDEVEEIRMKHEVDNFLNKVSPPPADLKSVRRTSLRNSLAKKLHDIEKSGHTDDNNKKMSAAVSRTLKRFSADGKDDEIKPFIDRLQKNEAIRKAPAPPSPSKALKPLMGYPPQDSGSLYNHAIHQQVDVSVYQRDYVAPQWGPSKPPQTSSHHTQELIIVMPRTSLPPSPGPGSHVIPFQQRFTQPTQTPNLRPGVTQTSSMPGVSTAPVSVQVSDQYGQQARPPSEVQMGVQSGLQPRQYFQQPQYGQPQASHAGVQSGPGNIPGEGEGKLIGDDVLCELCMKYPCEFFDHDDCDENFYPMPPMLRRSMMCPPCMMMPPRMPPFMY